MKYLTTLVHPRRKSNISVLLTSSNNYIREWIDSNLGNDASKAPKVVGFDVEWKPGGHRVALVQIAANESVLLCHLINLPHLPCALVEIISNRRFLKVCSQF